MEIEDEIIDVGCGVLIDAKGENLTIESFGYCEEIVGKWIQVKYEVCGLGRGLRELFFIGFGGQADVRESWVTGPS